jgi:hypothetical protein
MVVVKTVRFHSGEEKWFGNDLEDVGRISRKPLWMCIS